jgi:hypothetical protein
LRRLCLVVLLVATVGCAPESRPPLGIANGTTMTIGLFVNGEHVGTYAPGSGVTIPGAGLPSMPWFVEARTSTGRVVTSMRVEPDQVTSTTFADGRSETTGAAARVDLSCGRLDVWAGPPVGGPMPPSHAGAPGDCEP